MSRTSVVVKILHDAAPREADDADAAEPRHVAKSRHVVLRVKAAGGISQWAGTSSGYSPRVMYAKFTSHLAPRSAGRAASIAAYSPMAALEPQGRR